MNGGTSIPPSMTHREKTLKDAQAATKHILRLLDAFRVSEAERERAERLRELAERLDVELTQALRASKRQ